jgi:hypothetical protein
VRAQRKSEAPGKTGRAWRRADGAVTNWTENMPRIFPLCELFFDDALWIATSAGP